MTRRPKLVVDSRTVQAEAPIPVLPPKPRLTDTELEGNGHDRPTFSACTA